jgi:hypothetical protein
MPLDSQLRITDDVPASVAQFAQEKVEQMKFAHEAAKQILMDRKERMKAKSEANKYQPQFEVDDVVYIYDPVIASGNLPN